MAGHKDSVIAASVGLTPAGLARIVALPEYRDLEQSVLDGTISAMDQALVGKADLIKNMYREAVPLAIRAQLDAVVQRRDLRAALAAAKDILNRDPDHTLPESKPDSVTQPGLSDDQIKALSGDADKAAEQVRKVTVQ